MIANFKNIIFLKQLKIIRKKIYYISAIAVTLLLFFSFIGFTYYADAEAVSKAQVKVENLNLIKVYNNGVKLGFTVKFANPSDREINDLFSYFDIYVDSIKIGEGSFLNIDIKPDDETSKQMSVTASYSGLAQSAINVIKNFVRGEKTSLSIEGTVSADVLFGLAKTSHKFIATYN